MRRGAVSYFSKHFLVQPHYLLTFMDPSPVSSTASSPPTTVTPPPGSYYLNTQIATARTHDPSALTINDKGMASKPFPNLNLVNLK